MLFRYFPTVFSDFPEPDDITPDALVLEPTDSQLVIEDFGVQDFPTPPQRPKERNSSDGKDTEKAGIARSSKEEGDPSASKSLGDEHFELADRNGAKKAEKVEEVKHKEPEFKKTIVLEKRSKQESQSTT
ncbi:unnamed protein product [Soboliphyme baturini]|uniref:DUF4604 domain-containing protein n=1 Tax=Soboliphyme baturini TaxID=241478 RepID=A0A183I9J9_9BILA|nr:unnamed protein product [Soboliphyme baturini]